MTICTPGSGVFDQEAKVQNNVVDHVRIRTAAKAPAQLNTLAVILIAQIILPGVGSSEKLHWPSRYFQPAKGIHISVAERYQYHSFEAELGQQALLLSNIARIQLNAVSASRGCWSTNFMRDTRSVRYLLSLITTMCTQERNMMQ